MKDSCGETGHVPAMLAEVLDALRVRPDGVYVDCTLGGGGHAGAILERLSGGMLVCMDRDAEAVRRFAATAGSREGVVALHANFADVAALWRERNFPAPDGILYDLGVSSTQIFGGRGFSFSSDEVLDMRYDAAERVPTAADLVNSLSEGELEKLFFRFGERGAARRIARAIVRRRSSAPLKTTGDLVSAVAGAVRRRRSGTHPATRVFLALRALVNGELEALERSLRDAVPLAAPGGRVAAISYNSCEDRVVKDVFRRAERGCACALPPDECLCEGASAGRTLCPKGLTPGAQEVFRNPRARSARLRVFERRR
ncbi:MAG: 16S rRNA (cytosine(1402)-N(4))-methyltransferase RsmH [bacterium]